MKRLGLMFCFTVGVAIWSGCTPRLSWITVDPQSDVARPTFCLHDRRGKSEHLYRVTKPLYINEIIVRRFYEIEEHNQRELGLKTPWRAYDKVFWRMQYLPEDKKATHPLHCIRYGQVPPGYKDLVPAQPLEANRVYSVRLYSFETIDRSVWMRFLLRPDSAGVPMRLEYVIEGNENRRDPIVIERQAKEQ